MTDIPAPTPTPDANPDELLDGALDSQIKAAGLRKAAVNPNARVEVSDGRVLAGDGALEEAERLEQDAQFEAVMAIALFVAEIRDLLRHRQLAAVMPAPPIPHPGSADPEQAPEIPCVIEVYHPNHLWWSPPTDYGVPGAPATQTRYYCPGVRHPAPKVRTAYAEPGDGAPNLDPAP